MENQLGFMKNPKGFSHHDKTAKPFENPSHRKPFVTY